MKTNILLIGLFLVALGGGGVLFYRSAKKADVKYDIIVTEKGLLEAADPHLQKFNEDVPRKKKKKTVIKRDYSQYLTKTEIDQAIEGYIVARDTHQDYMEEMDKLSSKSVEVTERVNEVYMSMPPVEFREEHFALLNMVFELSQNPKEKKRAADQAKNFYRRVIESKVDPADYPPENSNFFFAFMLFTFFEDNNSERRRVADIVIREYNSPEITTEVEKLLKEQRP